MDNLNIESIEGDTNSNEVTPETAMDSLNAESIEVDTNSKVVTPTSDPAISKLINMFAADKSTELP